MAGAAALVAEARPNLAAIDLKSALVGSGGRLQRENHALPVISQGGGLVDPMHAATTEIAVEPSTLAFGAQRPEWSAVRPDRSERLQPPADDVVRPPARQRRGLAFSADPAWLTLQPGAAKDVTTVSATGEEAPAGEGGVIIVSAEGA